MAPSRYFGQQWYTLMPCAVGDDGDERYLPPLRGSNPHGLVAVGVR